MKSTKQSAIILQVEGVFQTVKKGENEKKKMITRTKNPNGSPVPENTHMNTCGFWLFFLREKKKIEMKSIRFLSSLLVLSRFLETWEFLITDTRTETQPTLSYLETRDLQGLSAHRAQPPAATAPWHPGVNQIAPSVLLCPSNYSSTALTLTRALPLSDFWFCFPFRGK